MVRPLALARDSTRPSTLAKETLVGAHADIKAGVPGGAALTRDNVTGNDVLAAERLDSRATYRQITSVFAMNRLLSEPWPVSNSSYL